jgi:hypothetical protein
MVRIRKAKYSPFILLAGFALAFSLLAGCASNPNAPGSNGSLTTSTEMYRSHVTAGTFGKDGSVPLCDDEEQHHRDRWDIDLKHEYDDWGKGSVCDSVVVTRARVVLSDLKLHMTDVDDSVLGHVEGTIRVGPFLAVFDSGGGRLISHVSIPFGTYDRIKFEIHKLNENEEPLLQNDSLFGDFVNGGRYTFIIDGNSYVGGVAYPFSFKSSLTMNVMVFIDPPAVFDSTSTSYNLAVVFDPVFMFAKPGMSPLDPRDPDNHKAIERMIRYAIWGIRK